MTKQECPMLSRAYDTLLRLLVDENGSTAANTVCWRHYWVGLRRNLSNGGVIKSALLRQIIATLAR